ncbi:MAG: hypothetical protein AAF495_28125 [Pseudomonadota bacterium]
MVATAEQVVRDAHAQVQAVERAIDRHPYLAAIASGSMSRAGLIALPGHQYHLTISGMRADATMLRRFGHTAARPFFHNLLEGEMAALANLLVLAAKMDLSEADLAAYEPSPEGFAYGCYVAWLADYGSAAEIVAGFLANLAAWGRNCGAVSDALRTHCGFKPEHTAFLDAFANLRGFDDVALPIIQDGLDQGVAPAAILRAVRLLQAYEKMFWDALARCAENG